MPWWGWLLAGLATGGIAMFIGVMLWIAKEFHSF